MNEITSTKYFEQTTLVAVIREPKEGSKSTIKSLRFGDVIQPVDDQTIQQQLDNVRKLGWKIISGRVQPTAEGTTICHFALSRVQL